MSRQPILRWIGWGGGAVILVALAGSLAVYLAVRASLAQLDGQARVHGLSGPATIERDAEGHVTVTGATRGDAARALGYVHAQERFFQMDVLRRSAAGSLAEVFGPGALPRDREARRFLGRRHANAALGLLPAEERAVVDAYAAGVNAGLDALGARPPEYLLLRQVPAPWLPEDTLLLNLAFGFALQDAGGHLDRVRDLLHRAAGPVASAFYNPMGSDSDAALDGHRFGEPRVPGPGEFRAPARTPAAKTIADAAASPDEPRPGSNAWALSGRRTRSGAALVADDMHLELSMPNVWFRAVIRWTDPDGRPRRLAGITVPGAPALIVGSNDDVAWGFTNSAIDTTDVIDLELSVEHPGQYRTPAGWRDFEIVRETVRVAGATGETLGITNTVWGPLIGAAGDPGLRAVAWVMARPEALASGFLGLENATNVATAIEAATRSQRPAQNFVVGDRAGNIGWTLIGALPDRFGTDGSRPVSWADGTAGWRGLLPAARHPRVINPASGQIWTANQRILGAPDYLALGDGGWDNGERAGQIRDDLSSLEAATPADMLAIQLDHRARMLLGWRDRLVPVLERLRTRAAGTTNETRLAGALARATTWDAEASATNTAFPLVARFRREAIRTLLEPPMLAIQRFDPTFEGLPTQSDAIARRLLAGRPANLLPPRFESYDALLEEAADRAAKAPDLAGAPEWGHLNRLRMQHPFARAMPWLSPWLDQPETAQSGYSAGMPRIAAPRFGASERLGVSPGHEAEGYLHMPGGQSGHFLSPFYRAGHDAWLAGFPSPLLGGPVLHRLILSPDGTKP
ncbi:MAG: penicillin acylase family protein [Verrucomicrobia bacterium]|nr:MAG: penicillin acylase family protein [Verrucomicrobiota bacterium]